MSNKQDVAKVFHEALKNGGGIIELEPYPGTSEDEITEAVMAIDKISNWLGIMVEVRILKPKTSFANDLRIVLRDAAAIFKQEFPPFRWARWILDKLSQ